MEERPEVQGLGARVGDENRRLGGHPGAQDGLPEGEADLGGDGAKIHAGWDRSGRRLEGDVQRGGSGVVGRHPSLLKPRAGGVNPAEARRSARRAR